MSGWGAGRRAEGESVRSPGVGRPSGLEHFSTAEDLLTLIHHFLKKEGALKRKPFLIYGTFPIATGSAPAQTALRGN